MSCPFTSGKVPAVVSNKRAIVVGGTAGIGEGIALTLARAQASVTIVGRNARAGEEIVKKLNELGGRDHEFLQCDASSLRNVTKFCGELKERHPVIDFLIQTQGMATIDGRTETPEGLDQKLSLHYFSRMCFLTELLPAVRKAENGKVLSVLSAGVHSPYSLYREDFELKDNFSLKNCADATGFYNDLGLDALSRQKENENVLFIHAAPGFVNTNWGTELPWYVRAPVRLLQPLGKSIEDCGKVMCQPLFHPPKQGGLFLMDANGKEASPTKLHDEARDFVWERTLEVLGRVKAMN
eukprot:TRINITY_DN801_c0_g1_i1.p1 TRINITY_DN801_c0_g1~~TRINITY_DN801_c0_g1_i1.p1  ORF type:complete len:310 (-),score=73.18 TRINITY_DN801_c0_g1_i1:47-934(-)